MLALEPVKKPNQSVKESIMYKHVLVAVDLSEESPVLLKKAVGVAKRHEAKLSIIHVDVNFSDLYTGLIDVNMSSMQDRISTETQKALLDLAESADYPISEKLSGSGDLGQVLSDAIEQYDVDLLVTGHHQDSNSVVKCGFILRFWQKAFL